MPEVQVEFKWLENNALDVARLSKTLFPDSYWDRLYVKKMNAIGNVNILTVCSTDGRDLVGYMAYKTEAPHQYHILQSGVTERYRRQGVGRRMMETLLYRSNAARRLGVSLRVSVSVTEDRTPAQKFLADLGFWMIRGVEEKGILYYDFVYQDHPENDAPFSEEIYLKKFLLTA